MDRVQRALAAGAAAGTVLLSCAADWLPLLLGWEVAAAALLLTAARSPAVSGAGARRLLLLTRAGSAALAAAAVTCLAADPSHAGIDWAAPGARFLVFAAAVGLGLWPLHQWLLEASPCRSAGAAAGALMVAGAVLLSRLGPGLGPLQPLVFGVGLTTAVAGAAAALASRGLRRIPAWIAVAHSGLAAAAMAAGPAAGWLLLAAALCARLCLSAGAGLAQAALPAAERLHELRGLAAHLPAARRLSLAGALIPVLSLSALWGQALLLGHARDEYGPLGPGVVLAVLALAAFPVVRFALAPFGGTAPRPAAAEPARPALPATAGCLAAGLAFAALPALCWWRLTPPPPEGLALAAAAGAAALGVSVLVRRRGTAPGPRPRLGRTPARRGRLRRRRRSPRPLGRGRLPGPRSVDPRGRGPHRRRLGRPRSGRAGLGLGPDQRAGPPPAAGGRGPGRGRRPRGPVVHGRPVRWTPGP